jgi:RNA polymerase sigma factor (sigma-70 family)
MKSSISIRLLQTQSDSRLVELAEAGSERAFEALVNRYRKPLLGYCRRLLLPEARAEDALQQGLLQAWLALRAGAEVRDAKAWLYRIVHNASISALRRSGYDYVELDESLHGACASEEDLERRIAVREALAGLAALPEAQREVLLRTALRGDSHEQVAAAMGLSEGAVRGLVYRARATLRTAVSALTPPQLLLWVSRAAETGGAHPQLAELVTGAGSAGLFGALLKGGAVLVSVGAIATGATLAEHHDGPAGSARASAIDAQAQAALLPSGSQSIRARFSAGGVTQTLEGVHARGERSRHGERGGREGHHGTVGRGGGSGVDESGRHDGSGSSGSGEASRRGDGGFSGSDGGSGSGSGGSKDGAGTSDGHGGGSPSGSSDGSRTNGSSQDGGSSGKAAPSEPVSSTQEASTSPAEADPGSSRHSGEATSTTGTDDLSSGSGPGH